MLHKSNCPPLAEYPKPPANGLSTLEYSVKNVSSLSLKQRTSNLVHNSFSSVDPFSMIRNTASKCEFQRVGVGMRSLRFTVSRTRSDATVDLLALFHNAVHFAKEDL